MTHNSETEIFFRGGPNGKVVAPGILMLPPVDKNRDSMTKKITFGPKYPNFGVKIAHFSPSLAANWSRTDQCFQHKRGVSIVP